MAYDFDEAPKPLPKVRLETIGEAWTLFQQQAGVWPAYPLHDLQQGLQPCLVVRQIDHHRDLTG